MSHRMALTMAAASVLALTAAPALGADPNAGTEGGKPYRDVRDGQHAEAVAQSRNADDVPNGQPSAARALVRAQGREAALELDPTTSTVRSLADLSGALTGSASGSRRAIALDYVRSHRIALGLTAADLDTLKPVPSPGTPDGVTVVRWAQAVDGIPLFDNGLAVTVDRAGRVLSVGGAPVHAPDPNATSPALSANGAEKALRANVGAGEETAEPQQVYFDVNGALRLAWRLRYRTSGTAHYDVVVDAATGRILHRANLVKFAVNVNVFPHYPGAPVGGTQGTVDIEPYLFAGASTMSGPYAREWADLNSDDEDPDDPEPDAGEELDPTTLTPSNTTFDSTFALLASGGCTATALCSWDHTTPTSWQANLTQNMAQLFWFVNQYRDHLASPAINFTQATGAFECAAPPPCTRETDDRVLVNADDGAATDPDTGGPDQGHVDNANMFTPPDGSPPTMQMYLFYNNPDGTQALGSTAGSPFRDVNGGDAAEIVFHEYTHGLSSRLVVDASGAEALNSPQSGAMGEAWSDWYAMDFLNRGDAPPAGMGAVDVPDDPGTPGEVDMGDYTDATPNSIRSQPLDCPVNTTSAACPGPDGNGATTADNGGYTYGDFGHVCCDGPEVHADGEIWAETLWQLRQALIDDLGSVTAGANTAEQLVTGAMRLSPPEPSFLDMRNAILLADNAINGGANNDTIWSVFAERGMGFFAGTINASDTSPAEDFHTPPATSATGTVAGTVTDSITGRPIGGARIAVGGLTSGETTSVFTTTSGANGAFSLPGLPVGSYGKVFETNGSGYDAAERRDVVVGAGTTTLNFALRRDWAARAGGAGISADTDAFFDGFNCGPSSLINQDQGLGWSAFNPTSPTYPTPTPANHLVAGQPPSATIQLPHPVDISSFEADPGATCGDGGSATTKDFRIETSRNGTDFTTAFDGTTPSTEFAQSDAGAMKSLVPTAGANAVRYVRLTLLSPQATGPGFSGNDFIDFSELAVYGNAVPTGALTASPASVLIGQTVNLDASSFTDDGSIVKYEWDFTDDGTIDQTTTAPTTSTTYSGAGTFTPRVRVTDDAGSTNFALTSVTVTAPAPVPTPAKPAAPRLTITGLKQPNGVSLRIVCSSACSGRAALAATAAFARRMGIPARTFSRVKINAFSGTSTVRVALKKSVLQRLRKRHVRSLPLTLSATVTDRMRQSTALARAVQIRISRR